jgi:hypothetical protein
MTDLNTPFINTYGDEACLADYPSTYVDQLYREHGDYADVIENIKDEDYTPGFCPERLVDVRGELFVNGHAATSHYIGDADFEFEVWESLDSAFGDDAESATVAYRFHWLRDNCKGAWLLHTTQHIKSWDMPFEVWVTFLDQSDEAAFFAAFPETSA